MGCGASSSAAAVPAMQNDLAPRQAATGATEEDLRSCWAAVAGGQVDATLSAGQVRAILEELGKRLSDEESAAAFKAMDTNGSGVIEFPEFVKFYNTSTVAEQKKIRALRAHQELIRRLESGSLAPDEERLVRERLSLPASPADSRGPQGTVDEENETAAATQQAAEKLGLPASPADSRGPQGTVDEGNEVATATQQAAEKLQPKQMSAVVNELDPDPDAPVGRMVVLELRGGNDKQKKGPGKGHRRDTFPICNAVKSRGWGCEVAVYSAEDHTVVATLCKSADAVIVRAAQGEPGVFGDTGPSKLYELLEDLVDMGVAVMPHPKAFRRLGAKRVLSMMSERQLPLSSHDTQVYEDVDEVRAVVTDVSWLAAGPRVLKANHSVQGESVWLCKRSEEAGTDGQIIVQHAQDGSIVTTNAEKFVDETLAVLFRARAESNMSMVSAWTADDPRTCYIVDQPFFHEVEDKGELLVTMVGPTPVALQHRVPAPGKFSATFKAGAKFEKCVLADAAWTAMRSSLTDVTTTHRPTTLMEASGCSADTPLPVLWTVELLPNSDSEGGFCAGEFDLGCIGISASLHLVETVVDAAIGVAEQAKNNRLVVYV